MKSLGERLEKCDGVGPGFDLLRLVLASLVVVYHSFRVDYGPLGSAGHFWFIGEMIVPMFFVLSGFLVTASARNHPPLRFFCNRFLRIYPALTVCVLFAALVMGPLVTTASLDEYFTSPNFGRYFLLLVGKVPFFLPGVFEGNPDTGVVNISLWTVRWEIGCYALLGLAAASGLRRKRTAILLGMTIILAPSVVFLALQAARELPGLSAWGRDVIAPHQYVFIEPAPTLRSTPAGLAEWLLEVVASWNFRIVPYFFAGAIAYLVRGRIPYSTPLALVFCVVLAAAGFIFPERWNGPLLYLMACVPILYVVLWGGLTRLPSLPLLRSGDYSYGVYLFGYPVQQLVVLSGLDHRLWWLNCLISLPLTLLMAMASWHLIEYPILRRRSALWLRFAGIDGPS